VRVPVLRAVRQRSFILTLNNTLRITIRGIDKARSPRPRLLSEAKKETWANLFEFKVSEEQVTERLEKVYNKP